MKALLLAFGFAAVLVSCESEYNRRIRLGKQLVESKEYVSDSELREELKFHAHLSGNERAFYEDIDTTLLSPVNDPVLLTRFP